MYIGNENYAVQSTYSDIISSNILRTILTGPGYLITHGKVHGKVGGKISIWAFMVKDDQLL